MAPRFGRSLGVLACSASAMSWSAGAHAAEPESAAPVAPLPAEYPAPSARGTHLLAGAAMTAAWYGGALGFSYLWPDAPGAEDLRIPIAGPWLALGHTGCAEDDPDCSVVIVVLRAVLTTIDGVGQVGGLAVMAEGLFLPTRNELATERTNAPSLAIRPSTVPAGKDGIGVGIVGVF